MKETTTILQLIQKTSFLKKQLLLYWNWQKPYDRYISVCCLRATSYKMAGDINEKTEKEVLKEIKSGVYRNSYLIYNRKSTDEPDNQKNSIKYQKSENARFAFSEHLPIASISLKV